MVPPFISQITTVPLVHVTSLASVQRHRMSVLPSPLKSGADDRPTGGNMLPADRGQNGTATHLPDYHRPVGACRSAGVGAAPQDVGLAVVAEVAGARARPTGGNMLPADRGQDGTATHLPDYHRPVGACRSAGVGAAPQDVGLAVAVEVVGADDRPTGGNHLVADVGQDRTAAHFPDRYLAVGAVRHRPVGAAPQDVGLAVAVEVAGADDLPTIGNFLAPDPGQDSTAVHLPDRHRPVGARRPCVGAAPQHVGFVIAVEIQLLGVRNEPNVDADRL